MSDKINQFCYKLKDRLHAAEGGLQSVKTSLEALPKKTEQSLRASLDEVQAKFHAEKDHVERIQADLSVRAAHKIEETRDAINEWKTKRETHKLNKRAERKESHAVDALDNALAAISYAEEAILEAAVARVEAKLPEKTTVAAN